MWEGCVHTHRCVTQVSRTELSGSFSSKLPRLFFSLTYHSQWKVGLCSGFRHIPQRTSSEPMQLNSPTWLYKSLNEYLNRDVLRNTRCTTSLLYSMVSLTISILKYHIIFLNAVKRSREKKALNSQRFQNYFIFLDDSIVTPKYRGFTFALAKCHGYSSKMAEQMCNSTEDFLKWTLFYLLFWLFWRYFEGIVRTDDEKSAKGLKALTDVSTWL